MNKNNLLLLFLCLLLITVACTEAALTATAPAGVVADPTVTPVPATELPPPEITLVNDVVTIILEQGFEESCLAPYNIYFNDEGDWRPGAFLPLQGDYILDEAYIELERQNEGCDVVGQCVPFTRRVIELDRFHYTFLGWQDGPDGEGQARAFATLPLSDEVRVEVNYFIDDECFRLAHFEKTLSR